MSSNLNSIKSRIWCFIDFWLFLVGSLSWAGILFNIISGNAGSYGGMIRRSMDLGVGGIIFLFVFLILLASPPFIFYLGCEKINQLRCGNRDKTARSFKERMKSGGGASILVACVVLLIHLANTVISNITIPKEKQKTILVEDSNTEDFNFETIKSICIATSRLNSHVINRYIPRPRNEFQRCINTILDSIDNNTNKIRSTCECVGNLPRRGMTLNNAQAKKVLSDLAGALIRRDITDFALRNNKFPNPNEIGLRDYSGEITVTAHWRDGKWIAEHVRSKPDSTDTNNLSGPFGDYYKCLRNLNSQ